jgi:integrase
LRTARAATLAGEYSATAHQTAAVRVGVGKIDWHTFRHSYSSLLRRVGADIKAQQELLRHSTIQSTMNVYTQAMSEGKRPANSVVVRSVLPSETCGGVIGA